MAGNQTHGFDLAIELSPNFFNQFLGTTLDSPTPGGGSSLLCQLLTALGHPELCGAFTLDVLMSRPTDLTIPATARDFLDIHIGIASGAMTIRLVVGIITDRSQPNADIFLLDFENSLFAEQVKIAGFPIPDALARPAISSTFKKIPLPSVPLRNGRNSTANGDIIRGDTRVIDDTSAAGLDAWALLLTFGGGAPGDLNAFTQSFVPSGGNGAVAIYFHWLLRVLSPLLASALGMPADNISDGHLVNPFLIDSDNDVTLTALDLTLEDGFIRVSAAVRKTGFCYSATGTIGAKLKIAVESGKLVVKAEVEDPNIDIDVPWYCWLGGIALGALLGGVLFGVIGAIVGGVLVPLITWLATEVIEGVINSVTEFIAGAINDLLPDVDVSIPGIEFVFNDIFIDDILIKANAVVRDVSPIKASGSVILRTGQYLDLDTGDVQPDDTAGADIHSAGAGFGRYLETVCRTTLARTYQKELASLARFNCYGYTYQMNARVPLGELAQFDVWGLLWGDKFKEEKYVYAVVTNENRYSLFRVTEVTDDAMRIEYKTFGVAQSLTLTGGFRCGNDWKVVDRADISFTPSPVLLQTAAQRSAVLLQARGLQAAATEAGLPADLSSDVIALPAPGAATSTAATSAPSSNLAVVGIAGASLDANIGRLGVWTGDYTTAKKDNGTFIAHAQGLAAPITFHWAINGNPLQGDSGTVTVDGKRMNWALAGNRLTLTPVDRQAFLFELKVIAVDSRATALTRIQCVHYVPICRVRKPTLPPFKLYKTHYDRLWGAAEVPLKNIVSPPPRPQR
jgi:hypothetical protein